MILEKFWVLILLSLRVSDSQVNSTPFGTAVYTMNVISQKDDLYLVFIYGKNHWCKRYESETKMLDVHHRDGNRSNNKLSNLEVLCVWCHALETRKDWPDLKQEILSHREKLKLE